MRRHWHGYRIHLFRRSIGSRQIVDSYGGGLAGGWFGAFRRPGMLMPAFDESENCRDDRQGQKRSIADDRLDGQRLGGGETPTVNLHVEQVRPQDQRKETSYEHGT